MDDNGDDGDGHSGTGIIAAILVILAFIFGPLFMYALSAAW